MGDDWRLLFGSMCTNYWFDLMGRDCNLRDSAVGEESARQAGETRRAKHEAAANAAWEKSLDPAWLAALAPDQANWQDGAETQSFTSSLMACRDECVIGIPA